MEQRLREGCEILSRLESEHPRLEEYEREFLVQLYNLRNSGRLVYMSHGELQQLRSIYRRSEETCQSSRSSSF